YKVDKENFTLTIYSSRPTTVSYRLTAPRFDAEKWSNTRSADDFATGFVIDDKGNIEKQANDKTVNQPAISSTKEVVYDGNIDQFAKDNNQVFSLIGDLYDQFIAANEALFAKLTAGFIQAENMVINNTVVAKNIVAEKVRSYELGVRRIFVEEKIVSPIVETTQITTEKLKSTQINTDKLETNEIKPVDKELVINLDQSVASVSPSVDSVSFPKGALARLIIKGLEGKTVASVDSAGNASFSGTLTAEEVKSEKLKVKSLEASEASLSGKLVAKEVESENINQMATLLNGYIAKSDNNNGTMEQFSNDINDIQKLLADIKNQPLPDLTNQTNLSNTTNLSNVSSLSSLITPISPITLTDLTVTGNSNLYTVSVSNSLLVGTTLMENNSIISLASELKLSALEKINLFDGAVIIAKDGSITTRGELIAQGGIRTNEIRALNDGNDINVNLSPNLPNSPNNPKLNISNQLGQNVASIDASGSAYFKALALEKFTPATPSAAIIAASDNFAKNGLYAAAIETASASAGIGILPENQSEVIIYNDHVKTDSLVYLTSTSDSSTNNQLTVSKKESCSSQPPNTYPLTPNSCKPYFRISSPTPSAWPIKFNWLIIN
ncbi:hypothetical protein COU86_03440, partial [Candidatus Roizmanbacteria bacterium CG10_big_fil_rev_8_21_14_0_10_36_26]